MAQTVLADMDTWKRIAGSADSDGAFTVLVLDVDNKAMAQQILAKLGDLLSALTGIRARLDAGLKTQTVATVGNVTL